MDEEKKKQGTKHITKKMAQKTADDIQKYWGKQGHTVNLWIERVTHGNARDYAVRSDMKNGFPCPDA